MRRSGVLSFLLALLLLTGLFGAAAHTHENDFSVHAAKANCALCDFAGTFSSALYTAPTQLPALLLIVFAVSWFVGSVILFRTHAAAAPRGPPGFSRI